MKYKRMEETLLKHKFNIRENKIQISNMKMSIDLVLIHTTFTYFIYSAYLIWSIVGSHLMYVCDGNVKLQ